MDEEIASSAWQWAGIVVYALVMTATVGRFVLCRSIIRRTTFLTPESPRWDGRHAPRVSILVPAKDEAANIEACLRSLLAQDYPNYEVFVVDDRSDDDTAAIAEAIACRDRRVRVIRIASLPEGWTGKTHALHVAQASATGSWLLFVDADALLHPACLSVTLRDAVDHQAGLASLMPRMEMRSFWERVVQPLAATLLMALYPLPKVNNRALSGNGFANGQYLLMRRTAYDAIGGHFAVRDKFCEDINLGRLIKQNDLGLRVTAAPALASVRMYSSLTQIVRGWSRIFYAAANGRVAIPIGVAVALFLISGVPYVMLTGCAVGALAGLTGPFLATLAGMAVLHEIAQTILHAWAYRAGHTPLKLLVWRPIATFALLGILLRTARLCRTNRVVWRGTQYRALSQVQVASPSNLAPVVKAA